MLFVALPLTHQSLLLSSFLLFSFLITLLTSLFSPQRQYVTPSLKYATPSLKYVTPHIYSPQIPSPPPGCHRSITSFSTKRDLSVRSGLFPSRLWILAPKICLYD
uniref:Uncharacterized protein n=1 Tax=Picea glauca TaxID=3330 RepID=A0A101M222_PICGL|nr:hypothetical protein ABT39_MTgene2849 [Picea glauca]